VSQFARATGTATYVHNTTVDFGGVSAKYVRITIKSNWGGILPQYGLSEVRFFQIPVRAREPQPASAATNVAMDTALSWRAGREAARHEVYLGTDPNVVRDATTPIKTVTQASCSLASLAAEYGKTYYWKVNEVNDSATPYSWNGDVWRFSTPQYATVDDFEAYNDTCNRIFFAWVDGYGHSGSVDCGVAPSGGNGTGSAVGNMNPPFAEPTIIQSGKQSMPMAYDNTGKSSSEAIRTFAVPQDWTVYGIKSLSLWFRGAAGNSGQLYVKINNTKVQYNGNADDIAKTAWIPWNIDLTKVAGNLNGVTKLTIGVDGSGVKGMLYIDDIRLYPKTPEYNTPTDPGSANLMALYAFEGNANDGSGHGLNGAINTGQLVTSGRTGGGTALQVTKAGYADLGNPAALDFGTGDWTVTAWYKTAMKGTGDANKGTIYAKGGDSTGGKRYALIMSETREGVVSLICDDDVTKVVVDSKSVTNDDQWHFVVGQREGTVIRIYIDWQLEGTNTVTAIYNLSGTSQHNAYIGAITNHSTGSLYKLYDGLIDDVRVYNRALTGGEVVWLDGQTVPVAKPF